MEKQDVIVKVKLKDSEVSIKTLLNFTEICDLLNAANVLSKYGISVSYKLLTVCNDDNQITQKGYLKPSELLPTAEQASHKAIDILTSGKKQDVEPAEFGGYFYGFVDCSRWIRKIVSKFDHK